MRSPRVRGSAALLRRGEGCLRLGFMFHFFRCFVPQMSERLGLSQFKGKRVDLFLCVRSSTLCNDLFTSLTNCCPGRNRYSFCASRLMGRRMRQKKKDGRLRRRYVFVLVCVRVRVFFVCFWFFCFITLYALVLVLFFGFNTRWLEHQKDYSSGCIKITRWIRPFLFFYYFKYDPDWFTPRVGTLPTVVSLPLVEIILSDRMSSIGISHDGW